ERAVDLEGEEIVAAHPGAPRPVDLHDDATVQFESRIGRIVGRRRIGAALLVEARRNMGRAQTTDGFELAEEVFEHVTPVREHVDDVAAPVCFAVVPGWPLRRLPVALEHPIAELAANREDASKET